MKRLVALTGAMAILALAFVACVRVEWWRMDDACNADPPGSRHVVLVDEGWSWKPMGFRCAFGDGSRRTSLWF